MRKPKGKQNRKPNGKSWEKRESRDMKRDNRKRDYEGTDTSTNNPAWYATDSALLRDSASIPFSWPLGQPFDQDILDINEGYIPDQCKRKVIPGIACLCITPTFGPSLESDALNVAASSMYSFVRHTNAGHANYDPNDLMLYVLAMTQVYSYINYLERNYAIATLYEQRNRYLPDGLFNALDIDADSIKNNLADFRYAINVLINKVSAIAVPATMTLFLRQAMMYAYVYAEGASIKDQLYLFKPNGFWQFKLDSDSAGCLEYVPMPIGPMSWETLIEYGTTMFNKIWEQEDFGIMSGDILKSYGSNILSLSSLNEVVPFTPIHDELILHQIKNASITKLDQGSLSLQQNEAKSKLLHYARTTKATRGSYGAAMLTYHMTHNRVLTLDATEPTPEMVIEATRLMTTYGGSQTAGDDLSYTVASASEVCTEVHVITVNPETSNMVKIAITPWSEMITGTASTLRNSAFIASLIKHFKYMPNIAIAIVESDTLSRVYDMYEVDNYAVLDHSDVSKMHTAAMLNMLNVPSAAKNPSSKMM